VKRSPFRPNRRRKPMSKVLRHAVWARDGGLCQFAGESVSEQDAEIHHRKLRSRGGQDTPENLITLCGTHHRAVHANPIASTERGFICPSTEDPAHWPVHRYLSLWAQPTPTGWDLPGGNPNTPGGDAA